MSTKVLDGQVKTVTSIGDGINLITSPKDQFGNPKFTLTAVTAEEFNSKCRIITYSINFQRYYLFQTVVGGNGDKWQQNLFLNLINYQPLGIIEWVVTIDSKTGKKITLIESMDGQQRTKTFIDIMDNKVRLPKGATIYYNKQTYLVEGLNFSELANRHSEYVDRWVKEYKFIILNSNLTKKEKHKRFVDVNNQNPLTSQDIRSSLDNPLSHWLNGMMFSDNPSYEFLYVDSSLAQFKHMPKLSICGKLIQEIVSKVLVYGYAGKYTAIGKAAIDELYNSFSEDGLRTEKDIDKIRPIFDEMMSTADYVITKSATSHFWQKRDILIFMITTWNLLKSRTKFDKKLLRSNYVKAIAQLKSNNPLLNNWALKKGYLKVNKKHSDNKLAESIRERNNTFASCYASGDSPITLEFVIETILSNLIDMKVVSSKTDNKRVFTQKQKQEVCALQNNKCACCHDELDPDNTSSYEGDHIIPHSEGGLTEIANCEVLCEGCHQMKTKLPEQYNKMRNKLK